MRTTSREKAYLCKDGAILPFPFDTMKKIFAILVAFLMGAAVHGQESRSRRQPSREQVIAQMNYCINSLTGVANNKSMGLLEHETDQLLNNLTMEQIVDLYDVKEFRKALIEDIAALEINEEERNVIRRIQDMRRKNMLSSSVANALNPTLLLVPGRGGAGAVAQAGFMAILTAARTAVDYQTSKGEGDVDELQAMWALRKDDIKKVTDLRVQALNLEFNLYRQFHLNEFDRLTEESANRFSDIVSETDPEIRRRRLEDPQSVREFDRLADYHYHLGMAYLDLGRYAEADARFNTYLKMYDAAPIFRYDEKSGVIALAKLAVGDGMKEEDRRAWISRALTNLPNNGAALIQCAVSCFNMGDEEMCFRLLRRGIDNPNLTDKDAVVSLVTTLMPNLAQHGELLREMKSAVLSCRRLDLAELVSFVAASGEYDAAFRLLDVSGGKGGNRRIELSFDGGYTFDKGRIGVYSVDFRKGRCTVSRNGNAYKDGIPLDEILKKVDLFKNSRGLICHYFDALEEGELYRFKPGLDYESLTTENCPGRDIAVILDTDIKKIKKLYKRHVPVEGGRTVVVSEKTRRDKAVSKGPLLADSYFQPGDVSRFDAEMFEGDPVSGKSYKALRSYGDIDYGYIPFAGSPEKIIIVHFMTGTPCAVSYRYDDESKAFRPYFIQSGETVVLYEPQTVAAPPVPKADGDVPRVESEKESVRKSFWQRLLFWKKDKKPESEDVPPENESVSVETPSETATTALQPADSVRTFWSRLMFWKK